VINPRDERDRPLAGIVGAAHVITDPDVLDGRSVDHSGRYRGHASKLRCLVPAATPACA